MEKFSNKSGRTRSTLQTAGVAGDASLLTSDNSDRLRLVVLEDEQLAVVTGGALNTDPDD